MRSAAPSPIFATFALSSSWASSISSRARALACSATCFAAPPTPPLVPRVGMAPPVDHLREHDADRKRRADDEERVEPFALRLRTLHLRSRRSRGCLDVLGRTVP